MKKTLIPAAILVFLLSVHPVYAANFWDNWKFGSLFDFFTNRTNREDSAQQGSPSGFSRFTQTPTPRPTKTESFGDDRPSQFGKPTTTPRPTRVMPTAQVEHANNEEQNRNENKKETTSQEREQEKNGDQSADEAKAKRALNAKDVATRLLERYEKRLTNYNDFLTKVKTRRDKLAADGNDVTKLDSFIATATTNLTNAQTVFASVKTALLALDYTGDMGTLKKSIQEQLTKLRQAMTTLHKSMSETVSNIVTTTATSTKRDETGRPTPKIKDAPAQTQRDQHGTPGGKNK